MDSILESLNAAQRAAVTSPASVLQILAPPGSGKTKTLTSRVAYLLSHRGYKPWNILCVTFTIKSAKEMKERISKMITDGSEKKLILGTFHSVCRRYLVSYGHHIGIPKGFGIADSADSLSIITRIVKRLRLNIDPRVARARISSSKARSVGYTEVMSDSAKRKNVDQQEFATIFEAYELHLATSNLLDYDDLLLKCADLLDKYPVCVSNVEAVLIDEFQDTNHVQYRLMQLFSAKKKCITIVGDPDQSIYGWRSAEIKNLEKMCGHYTGTLVIHLEDNYRSSATILLAALEVIQQDSARHPKPLNATHCPSTPPVLRRLPSAEIEAKWMVTEIQRLVGLTGSLLDFSDFAILLRSATLWNPIELEMGRTGIPYRVVGGHRFFDRAEIKLLLDYLRVICQPENTDALARIINEPKRGVGDTTVKALLEEAAAKKSTLWGLIRNGSMAKVSNAAERGISSFINLILTARKQMARSDDICQPYELLDLVVKKLEFKTYLEKKHKEDHEDRWANVEELLAQASDMSISAATVSGADELEDALPESEGQAREQGNIAEEALSRFLANVALSTEKQRDGELDAKDSPRAMVTISTIHAAKGLEWPVVFIPCAYEGSIPHSRSEDTDEERRLLYVAMTRAQALLYMSYPTKNMRNEETDLSSFLKPKKVASYLTNKGPSIDQSLVRDLCSILRRDFPKEYNTSNLFNSVDNIEDNLWPLDGEKNPEEANIRWIQHREAKIHDTSYHQWHSGRASATVQSSTITTSTHASNFTIPKGSSSSAAFTHNSAFVTASSHLRDWKETQISGQKRARAVEEEPNQSAASRVKTKKIDKSQGTLSSFLSLPSNKGPRDGGLPVKVVRAVELPTSSLTSKAANVSTKTHSTINQEWTTRTLTPIQNTFRPPKPRLSSNHPTNSYPHFSSSPPRPDRENVPDIHDNPLKPDPNENCETHPLFQPTSSKTGGRNFSRPSSTFHNTTLEQVQNRKQQSCNAIPKRTLGTKRAVQGWQPVNSGFRPPTMNDRG
ncbi:MAG: hypothetical protein MMC33_009265 [Icmadophila ericetorum]|nr:hypothetical protein [Icmadophila ericetorum]